MNKDIDKYNFKTFEDIKYLDEYENEQFFKVNKPVKTDKEK